jgi:hypothetical protein
LNKARPFYETVFGMKFDEFRPPFASATLGSIEFNIEENATYRSPDWPKLYIGVGNRYHSKPMTLIHSSNKQYFLV